MKYNTNPTNPPIMPPNIIKSNMPLSYHSSEGFVNRPPVHIDPVTKGASFNTKFLGPVSKTQGFSVKGNAVGSPCVSILFLSSGPLAIINRIVPVIVYSLNRGVFLAMRGNMLIERL